MLLIHHLLRELHYLNLADYAHGRFLKF